MDNHYVNKVIDLTNPEKNVIYNMTHEEAVNILKSGDAEAVRNIDGQYCTCFSRWKNYKNGPFYRTANPLFHCKKSSRTCTYYS